MEKIVQVQHKEQDVNTVTVSQAILHKGELLYDVLENIKYEETDPTVPDWAKQETKPSYTAEEVGAIPNDTFIPTKTSDLNNDSGFITGYTETDPTVPAWAKEAQKPTYTAQEVGALPSSTTIPSKTSQLTNDSGFLTQHQDISSKQDVSTAVRHTESTKVGSSTRPVYIAADGTATQISYTISKSVPSNAVFTDTTYSNATQSVAGLLSAVDKTKLDGLDDIFEVIAAALNDLNDRVDDITES